MSYFVDGVTYYTVRFLNYAGTDLLGTADVEAGGDATPLAPTTEVFEDKVFVGWNADITKVMEDMTVRPVYQSLFVVTFMNADGTEAVSIQYVEPDGDAVPPTPEKISGKIFISWSASFFSVNSDRTINPIYREIPPRPELKFYEAVADGSSGELIKTYRAVNSCSIVQKLSGECTIDVSLLTRNTEGHVDVNSRLEVEGLVFYINGLKKNISGGICYTQFIGEHITYILNNDEYKVAAFDQSGTVKSILKTLLKGTPFTVGTVDIETEVTLRINKECTRRAAIMQLLALADGEIEYYGYTIGIRSHVGNETPIDILKKAAVQDISFSYSVADNTTNYEISLYKKGTLELGDELIVAFKPMEIETESRIVGMDWNPFNRKEVRITIGAYIPTLNDSLYDYISMVQDITESTAKYTVEFGELIGNGTFYFTHAYLDRPYYHIHTDDGSEGTITLNRKDGSAFGSYVGATLSGVQSTTTTVVVFYCTISDEA
ncbi:phage tail protein [Lachnoclostridium phytofermentans]|uniref:phage tail protein n=1 Tax=Lachnoclostridium phytofermentans TaxID=66219 RepID=UPI000495698C|nr:phage tail protein [Lachnoclostridium phytofermentans]